MEDKTDLIKTTIGELLATLSVVLESLGTIMENRIYQGEKTDKDR